MQALLCLIGLLGAVTVKGQTPTPQTQGTQARPQATLHVEEAACLTTDEFQQRVRERLGYDPFVPEASREIHITATQTDDLLAVHIETLEGEEQVGERDFEGSEGECPSLLAAAALSVSIAIDPAVLDREANPSPPPEPPVVPPEPSEPPPQVEPEPEPIPVLPEGPAIETAASVMVQGAIGSTPGITGEVVLAIEIRRAALRVGIGVRGGIPRSTSYDEGEIAAHYLGTDLSICGELGSLFGCALGLVGATRVHGQGYAENHTRYLLYVGGGVRVGASFELTERLALRAQLDLIGQFTPARALVGEDVAWEMGPISGAFGLGLRVRLE